MKKTILASTALVGLTFGASAADLPRRAAPPVYAPAIPVFTWTGFYVGVNAGYGFNTRDNESNVLFVPPGTFAAAGVPFAATTGTLTSVGNGDSRNGGFVGGGQVGFNYQLTPGAGVVFGFEADAQYADLNRRNDQLASLGIFTPAAGSPGTPPGFVAASPFANQGVDWFGTARGRLGYAFDRFMIYGTGGLAYGNGRNNNSFGCGFAVDCSNDVRIGWTAGGGVEYAFTNNISAKLEGLYVSLDRRNNGGSVVGFDAARTYTVANGLDNRRDDSFAVVRAGLNFKFGGF
jgi:outer membrane immunogenic protein